MMQRIRAKLSRRRLKGELKKFRRSSDRKKNKIKYDWTKKRKTYSNKLIWSKKISEKSMRHKKNGSKMDWNQVMWNKQINTKRSWKSNDLDVKPLLRPLTLIKKVLRKNCRMILKMLRIKQSVSLKRHLNPL